MRKRRSVAALAAIGATIALQFSVVPPAAAATEGDLVFIVDESGSLGDEQAAVRNNLTSLTNQINMSGIDARYGLVGYGNGGGAHGANSGHTHANLGPLAAFQTALNDLVVTGGVEPAFDAIVHAGGLNYRPNAKACVVLITDEPSNGDVNNQAGALASLTADNATFFGIYDTGSATSNAQFNPLASGTGGQNFSLAAFTTDPAAVLSALGSACAAAITGGISLSPATATNDVGTPHTVTASLIDANNNPISGAPVTFTVTSGPNAGASGTCVPAACTSNAAGQVSFTYTGNGGAGTDTITACFVDASGAQRCATASKTWVVPIMVSVNDVVVNEGDAGLTPATFTVSLSQPAPPAGVTVLASTANGSATAPSDYLAQTNTPISFAAGQTSAPFAVQVVGDLVNEPDETFLVNLSSPTNATIADGQGVGTIIDDERDGAFSCRASALRVTGLVNAEPTVANPPNSPCADDAKTQVSATVTSGSVNVTSRTLNASTDQTPNLLEPTPPAATDNAVATASLERATATALSLVNISATGVQAQARVQCTAAAGGGLVPAFTSSSTIASLTINGIPLNPNATGVINLPAGLGTIELNQTTTTATSVTRRAVRIMLLGQEIVLGEARANFSGNPCDQ